MCVRLQSILLGLCLIGSQAIHAQTIIDVNPNRSDGLNFAPIQQLVLDDTVNNTIITQTASVSPTLNSTGVQFPRATPFNLVSATVDDGGPKTLIYTNVVHDVVLQGFAVDGTTPNQGGVEVFYPDNSRVTLAPNATARNNWRIAVAESQQTVDLLNYILYDGDTTPLPPDGTADWDVIYKFALQPENYLMVMERHGNTFFIVQPLDENGNLISGANALRFGSCADAPNPPGCTQTPYLVYDWNVGVAHTTYQPAQAMGLSIAPVSKFFQGTSVPAAQQRVFGLRIENKGNADVKFFGLSEQEFEFNDPLPGVIGDFVWVDLNGNGLQDPGEPGLNGVLVRLLDSSGNPSLDPLGEPITMVTQNGPDNAPGWYRFAGLPAGDYIVEIDPIPGFAFTTQNADSIGVEGASNSDVNPGTRRTPVFALAAGATNLNVDGGLRAPDFGSLPAGYPTFLQDNGPRHVINIGDAFLGAVPPDGEADAVPGGDNADGEDEDGVEVWSNWTPNSSDPQTVLFRVTVGQAGVLSMFMDSDAGTPSALIAPQFSVLDGPNGLGVPAAGTFTDVPVVAGAYVFAVTLPANSAGDSIATRWRITNAAGQGGALATGGASTGEVEDFLFQYNDDGVPVVLASVESERVGSQVRVRWATASEVGNVGFRFIDGDGARALHSGLIESSVIDSTEPSFYELNLETPGNVFYIEDVDVFGVTERHGPFVVGESFGRVPELQSIDWAQIQTENAATRSAPGWTSGIGQAIRLETDQVGPHRVSYADLANAGIDLGEVQVMDLALTWRGQPVPFHTSADTVFGEHDWIEFVAESSNSLYSAENIYLLHLQRADDHRRVELDQRTPPAVTALDIHLEVAEISQPKRYSFAAPSADPWIDTQMTVQGSPRNWDFVFPVDALRSDKGSAKLELTAWGMTRYADIENDHHLQVFVNLQQVADLRFDGRALVDLDVSFDSALLNDGENLLTLRMPGVPGVPAAVVAFQKATVSYPRALSSRSAGLSFAAAGEHIVVGGALPKDALVYRVTGSKVARVTTSTDFDQLFSSGFEASVALDSALLAIPGHAQSSRYFLVDNDNLPTPRVVPGQAPVDLLAGAADYLVISHPLFMDGLAPLLDFHRDQGRTVRVVDVLDIHAQYSDGFPEGQGIQGFLRDAAATTGFSHVLLVGGDTYDYRGYLTNGSISFVPTLYASSSDLVQHMPADALLVDLNGDGMPDRAIGRLPVRNATELTEVVQKTLDYASRSYRQRVLLAADELEPARSYSAQSETLISSLGQNWAVQRAYLDQLPVAQARNQILDAINQGQSLVTFTGHSSFSVWTFKGLFAASDVNSLAPNRKPTVVAQWGCWNTYHVNPNYNTMGHRFMLAQDRGAAAVMGSSTFTNARSSEVFVSVLSQKLAQPGLTIGEAVLQAKQQMDPAASKDMILGWTILGDPAVRVAD